MIKKSFLAVIALSLFACSTSYGQFVTIKPSDVGVSGTNAINQLFDISSDLGQADNTTFLRVANGYISSVTDSWTVSESETTVFILEGPGMAEAFVNHGPNLGSEDFQNGSLARDGLTSALGETWTLTTTLDADYTAGQNASDYFVDYTGVETNQLESNSSAFRWFSDQAVSSFSVFSTNTDDLNNDYNVGFQAVNAIPEPSSGIVLALAGLLAVRRKKN